MSCSGDASGLATVTLYFFPGTNPTIASGSRWQNKSPVGDAKVCLKRFTARRGRREGYAHFMMFFTLSTIDDSSDEVGPWA